MVLTPCQKCEYISHLCGEIFVVTRQGVLISGQNGELIAPYATCQPRFQTRVFRNRKLRKQLASLDGEYIPNALSRLYFKQALVRILVWCSAQIVLFVLQSWNDESVLIYFSTCSTKTRQFYPTFQSFLQP